MKASQPAAATGRPRAFDPDQALENAMQVFWRKGYDGTSLSDLTAAMGINRPSLYAAFGNKEELFRKALDRYANGPASYATAALEEPKARAAVERLLRDAADLHTDPRHAPGCLLVHGALCGGEETDSVRRETVARRAASEDAIRRRLERARAEGDLPPGADPADLALYLATVIQGMAVQAAGGATRDRLERVIQAALQVWPTRARKVRRSRR
jgi:AcrR family transcriptional regulator